MKVEDRVDLATKECLYNSNHRLRITTGAKKKIYSRELLLIKGLLRKVFYQWLGRMNNYFFKVVVLHIRLRLMNKMTSSLFMEEQMECLILPTSKKSNSRRQSM